jgi:hypothetical protein
MDFPHLTYSGPPIDDPEILARVPAELMALLNERNGLIALSGGFHLRGACKEPDWHSLRYAWEGPGALHQLFAEVLESDVPFAEEACGDQFLLRNGQVIRLAAETGEVGVVGATLAAFLAAVRDDGVRTLGLEPLLAFLGEGQALAPGQLLSVYPPFCTVEARNGVSLKAIPAGERIAFLAGLAQQLMDLPDGAQVELKTE